jgi:hypothetical protein
MLCNYSLDGDWQNTMLEVFEEDDDYDTCIWHLELNNGEYEFFIYFNELCNAKQINNNTWSINAGGNLLTIEFKK